LIDTTVLVFSSVLREFSLFPVRTVGLRANDAAPLAVELANFVLATKRWELLENCRASASILFF
jgi:hypothetical protein